MTKAEYRNYYKTGKYFMKPLSVIGEKDSNETDFKLVEGQACSIKELMLRQAQGLPMPNLTATIHTEYNGYNIEDMPITAKRGADIIDVDMHSRALKSEIQEAESIHKEVQKRKSAKKTDEK